MKISLLRVQLLITFFLAHMLTLSVHAESTSQNSQQAYVFEGQYLTGNLQQAEDGSRSSQRSQYDFDYQLIRLAGRETGKNARIIPLDAARVQQDCEFIRSTSKVYLCEPNLVRFTTSDPNDKRFSEQWALHPSPGDYHVNVHGAWQLSTGSEEVIVGILDTGINYLHPDLRNNIWVNPVEIDSNGIDDDGNGYVDDVFGTNVIHRDGGAWDCDGHGSHVAGIIGGAGNNSLGISGVNWKVNILPVGLSRCEEQASFGIYEIVQGIHYLLDLKKRYDLNIVAVNASFSGGGASGAERSAIEKLQEQGVVLVTAAGNSSVNIDKWKTYPASYNLENIITVTALTRQGQRAGFANYGPKSVDLGAPGVSILSTYRSQLGFPEQYKLLSGTSMAAPFVTGTMALLSSLNTELSPAELISLVKQSAGRLPELFGEVNDSRALDIGSCLTQNSIVQIDQIGRERLLSRYAFKAKRAIEFTTLLATDGNALSRKSVSAKKSQTETQLSLRSLLKQLRFISRRIQWLSARRPYPALHLKRLSKRAVSLLRKTKGASHSESQTRLSQIRATLQDGLRIARRISSQPLDS